MQVATFFRAAARHAAGAAALALAAPAAFAHYLWVETEGTATRVYFGEVNEVREQSPGRLDEIVGPRLVAIVPGGADREVPLQRRRGSFAAASTAPELLAVETGYAVQDWSRQGIGVVKPMFYARSSAWPARSVADRAFMRLDIRPAAAAETVQVHFDGKPLAGAKLVVHAPNGWDQEHKADERGMVPVALPWRGQYVLEVVHKESTGGEFGGKRFEATRHRATWTFRKAEGVDPAGTGVLAPRIED